MDELVINLPGLEEKEDSAGERAHPRDDVEPVAPGQEVHIGSRHPLPVLGQVTEHDGSDEDKHG